MILDSPNGLSGSENSKSPLKMDSSTKKTVSNSDMKSPKGRGRKQNVKAPSVSPEITTERVFIWDLDETLIIFQSLINGTFGTKFQKVLNNQGGRAAVFFFLEMSLT